MKAVTLSGYVETGNFQVTSPQGVMAHARGAPTPYWTIMTMMSTMAFRNLLREVNKELETAGGISGWVSSLIQASPIKDDEPTFGTESLQDLAFVNLDPMIKISMKPIILEFFSSSVSFLGTRKVTKGFLDFSRSAQTDQALERGARATWDALKEGFPTLARLYEGYVERNPSPEWWMVYITPTPVLDHLLVLAKAQAVKETGGLDPLPKIRTFRLDSFGLAGKESLFQVERLLENKTPKKGAIEDLLDLLT